MDLQIGIALPMNIPVFQNNKLFIYLLGALLFASTACKQEEKPMKPLFSFGIFADVQYVDWEPVKTRHYRESIPKLKEIVQNYNQEDLEFVIHLGDLIDEDIESFSDVLPLFKKFKAPVYQVVGNHDYSVSKDKKSKVLPLMGLQKGYYDFKVKNWRFLVLDGNEISFFTKPFGFPGHDEARAMYDRLKEQNAVNAQSYNGAMSKTQIDWMEQQLQTACGNDEKVIIFSHYPIYPQNLHNLWNDEEVLRAVESFDCVKAYFNGHNHYGNYAEKEGLHFLTLEAVVETPDTNAYGIIDVYEDRLVLRGRGRLSNKELKTR